LPASLGLHRLMLERFCKLFHVHQLAQGWTTRHCVLPQHYCCIMRCVVCVWKYLTTIYHFIIAAFTQNHDSTHSSSCQHKTRSQHGATLTQPLFMPSYSSTCPVNIPKLLFTYSAFCKGPIYRQSAALSTDSYPIRDDICNTVDISLALSLYVFTR